MWGDAGLQAVDCGAEAAAWFSRYLGLPVHLVTIDTQYRRPVKESAPGQVDQVSFADGAPLLVVSEESLQDLNDRLVASGSPAVPMNRFRPNLVVRGTEPYAEDHWAGFTVGSSRFRMTGPCARCIMTTTDQSTLARTAEPLRTLAKYRRGEEKRNEVYFAQNVVNESKEGVVRLGDEVFAD